MEREKEENHLINPTDILKASNCNGFLKVTREVAVQTLETLESVPRRKPWDDMNPRYKASIVKATTDFALTCPVLHGFSKTDQNNIRSSSLSKVSSPQCS